MQTFHGVTSGRPKNVKPLHPTRTPVQFSKKKGPKLKPQNSLLPALFSQSKSPTKPVNFSPKKSPSKETLPVNVDDTEVYIISKKFSCSLKISDLHFG